MSHLSSSCPGASPGHDHSLWTLKQQCERWVVRRTIVECCYSLISICSVVESVTWLLWLLASGAGVILSAGGISEVSHSVKHINETGTAGLMPSKNKIPNRQDHHQDQERLLFIILKLNLKTRRFCKEILGQYCCIEK